ncbi:3-alpha-hydroxysteroid dehydrogenase [Staphylococcus felis]|uniref:Diacetyl reductase [(S)-acetoin forming] n=1 Tax=Staphylococcus felis TaxID=46127 RepID=A0A3E0IL81_9STAP|nr:glucose 1-dehydrogenase [Staphylococcus felis]REH77181.1 3-alpha-hydroxysteroid dehydrogenase [Staphylococcus felis]REH78557.1 3-alpha-hydroxysteroid dehydrogenase [Staphylococcus felis]REH79211.1 3-alpha-hydroxysteroid dehydrogenase [Staphylococcus felis]REH81897.1 3-alpha-hydroxysteroid dehydrogenase [Staphylococcus felis]REH90003.1 3-alpha-hydroxysteroid dehydrogenase [Staphylococcus felis]
MKRLTDKVVIITGGAQGMGKLHAEKALSEGAKVVITDINESVGQVTAQSLGEDVLFIQHDVSKESDWQHVVDTVMSRFERIDVLINNAGITYHKSIDDVSLEDYMKIVNINQVSVFLGIKVVSPIMKQQELGSIINISSMNGLVGGAIGYTDTKFAVRGMTKAAARELSPYNIRVNSVHPGVIQTPMLEEDSVKEAVNAFKKTIPMRRIAQPEEVSNLVCFLASDEASYSTGSEFVIDGGMTAL